MRTALALALLAWLCAPARAETILAGDRDALSIVTHDAAIDEVLGALGEKFDLRYRAGQPLTRRLSGTYSGPLRRCVAQILAGYDYIIRSDGQRIEVVIVGPAGAPKSAGTAGAPIGRTARRVD